MHLPNLSFGWIVVNDVTDFASSLRRRMNEELRVAVVAVEEEPVKLHNARTAVDVVKGDHPAIGPGTL